MSSILPEEGSSWNIEQEEEEVEKGSKLDFTVDVVQYKPPHSIVQILSSSNSLVISLATTSNISKVIRLDLKDEDENYEIVCSEDGTKIKGIFLDPTASHLVVSMDKENGDNLYYFQRDFSSKPKSLKIEGKITAIGWDKHGLENSQISSVLCGLDNGDLVYAVIEPGADLLTAKFTTVFSLNGGPIKDIYMCRFPNNITKLYIIVTTATRLYQFIGSVRLEELFELYQSSEPTFREMLGDNSILRIHNPGDAQHQLVGWLTGSGLLIGNIMLNDVPPRSDAALANAYIMNYPDRSIPSDFILTDFHIMLLYHDRVIALSRLLSNKSGVNPIVWEYPFRGYPMIGVVSNSDKALHFLYAKNKIYELHVKNETKNLWRIYLQLGNYDLAEKYAQKKKEKEQIFQIIADSSISNKDWNKAALYFAKLPTKSVEESVLFFIHYNQREALCVYLLEKLKTLRYRDATQKVCLATWLLELYLQRLDSIEDTNSQEKKNEKELLIQVIKDFLKTYKNELSPKTVECLLAKFGHMDLYSHYAAVTKDFSKLVEHFLENRMWKNALTIFEKVQPEKVYEYAPVLMKYVPEETVEVLKKINNNVSAHGLIPALMQCNYSVVQGQDDPVQKYLEFAIKEGNTEESIHNLLLSMYAKKTDQSLLLNFVNVSPPRYSLDYALQLCLKHDKKQAVVLIYAKMGLYQESINLALKEDINLAKTIAKNIPDDELKKNIWLHIVKYLAKKKKNVKEAISSLQQCSLLKIEDILRFLPDDMNIEEVSEEICQYLEASNATVKELNSQMEKSSEMASIIREDIRKAQDRLATVNEEQTCALTHLPIKGREFYYFQDGSAFLTTALIAEVKNWLPRDQLSKLEELESKLETVKRDSKEAAAIKESTSDIVAGENPFYSKLFINTIKKPFGTEDSKEILSWKL